MAHYIWDVTPLRAQEIQKFLSEQFNREVTIEVHNPQKSETVDHLRVRLEKEFESNYDIVYVRDLAGQCGILLVYYLSYDEQEVAVVNSLARILNYRTVMVTHVVEHPNIKKYIENDYQIVWENLNTHSGNTIQVCMKDVGDPTDDECVLIEDLFPYDDDYDNDYDEDYDEDYDFGW